MDRVHDIEEVVPGWTFVLSVDVREIRGKLRVFLQVRPQSPDRQLIVVRDLDGVYIGALQQLLVPGQDILEKVLVDH